MTKFRLNCKALDVLFSCMGPERRRDLFEEITSNYLKDYVKAKIKIAKQDYADKVLRRHYVVGWILQNPLVRKIREEVSDKYEETDEAFDNVISKVDIDEIVQEHLTKFIEQKLDKVINSTIKDTIVSRFIDKYEA